MQIVTFILYLGEVPIFSTFVLLLIETLSIPWSGNIGNYLLLGCLCELVQTPQSSAQIENYLL